MIRKSHFLAVYAMLIAAGLYLQLHKDTAVPMNRPFDQFPTSVNGWRMSGETFLSGEVQGTLKATDTLMRRYVNASGETVLLYIGYHGGGKGGGEIHSPKHCLPGSGWLEQSSSRKVLQVAGGELELVAAVYHKGESKELFLYWYDVRGRSVSDEFSLKGEQILNSFLKRRRDASFIRISVPFEGDQRRALVLGEAFIQDFASTIRTFLPT